MLYLLTRDFKVEDWFMEDPPGLWKYAGVFSVEVVSTENIKLFFNISKKIILLFFQDLKKKSQY